jgi:hypothetical protein
LTFAGHSSARRIVAGGRRSLARPAPDQPARGFIDILRPPDSVIVQTTPTVDRALRSIGDDRWEDADVIVTVSPAPDALRSS